MHVVKGTCNTENFHPSKTNVSLGCVLVDNGFSKAENFQCDHNYMHYLCIILGAIDNMFSGGKAYIPYSAFKVNWRKGKKYENSLFSSLAFTNALSQRKETKQLKIYMVANVHC